MPQTTSDIVSARRRELVLACLTKLFGYWEHASGWYAKISSGAASDEEVDKLAQALDQAARDVKDDEARQAFEGAAFKIRSLRDREAADRARELGDDPSPSII